MEFCIVEEMDWAGNQVRFFVVDMSPVVILRHTAFHSYILLALVHNPLQLGKVRTFGSTRASNVNFRIAFFFILCKSVPFCSVLFVHYKARQHTWKSELKLSRSRESI